MSQAVTKPNGKHWTVAMMLFRGYALGEKTKMINTKQAAQSLGITPRRVIALISAGRLPAIKIGRDWIISESDLDLVRDRKPGRPAIQTDSD